MKALLSIWKGAILVREPLPELLARLCAKRMCSIRSVRERAPGCRSPGVVSVRQEFCYEAACQGYQDKDVAAYLNRSRESVTHAVNVRIRRGFAPPAQRLHPDLAEGRRVWMLSPRKRRADAQRHADLHREEHLPREGWRHGSQAPDVTVSLQAQQGFPSRRRRPTDTTVTAAAPH